jgi:hypothetical protein
MRSFLARRPVIGRQKERAGKSSMTPTRTLFHADKDARQADISPGGARSIHVSDI